MTEIEAAFLLLGAAALIMLIGELITKGEPARSDDERAEDFAAPAATETRRLMEQLRSGPDHG